MKKFLVILVMLLAVAVIFFKDTNSQNPSEHKEDKILGLKKTEKKKLCRPQRLFTGEGISFINGSFTIGLNKTAKENDIMFAYVSINRFNPPDQKIRAGWSHDFETELGTYRLVIEKISKSYIRPVVYPLDGDCP